MSIETPESLPQIRWQNQTVITTELLAQCYETTADRIHQSYSRNKTRFIEGKHFFKLEGVALKSFKAQSSRVTNSHSAKSESSAKQMKDFFEKSGLNEVFGNVEIVESHDLSKRYSVNVPNNINSLVLWTEKGAARHAKILDTDAAWDVFERMEEVYFHPERMARLTAPQADVTLAEKIAAIQDQNRALQEKLIAALEQCVKAQEQRLEALEHPAPTLPLFGVPRPWTQDEKDAADEMQAKGYGYTRIGLQLQRTTGSVARYFYRAAKRQGGAK